MKREKQGKDEKMEDVKVRREGGGGLGVKGNGESEKKNKEDDGLKMKVEVDEVRGDEAGRR